MLLFGCGSEDDPVDKGPVDKGPDLFPCDVECMKKEATRQGANVLTSLDKLKFNIDVRYSAAEDKGTACDEVQVFPAFKDVVLNPQAQLKLTTAHTREEPDVTFECEEGKSYHLVLNDALGGVFQNSVAYTHWVKLNMGCVDPPSLMGTESSASRRLDGKKSTKASSSGINMLQGSSAKAGWFSGVGYLPPAFPYNTFHHFNFYLFETEEAFTPERVEQFNTDFPTNNALRGAWTIAQLMANLQFDAPVARTWMDVTTSYWSDLRMGRNENFKDSAFYLIICECNQPGSWPGLYQNGTQQCNI